MLKTQTNVGLISRRCANFCWPFCLCTHFETKPSYEKAQWNILNSRKHGAATRMSHTSDTAFNSANPSFRELVQRSAAYLTAEPRACPPSHPPCVCVCVCVCVRARACVCVCETVLGREGMGWGWGLRIAAYELFLNKWSRMDGLEHSVHNVFHRNRSLTADVQNNIHSCNHDV